MDHKQWRRKDIQKHVKHGFKFLSLSPRLINSFQYSNSVRKCISCAWKKMKKPLKWVVLLSCLSLVCLRRHEVLYKLSYWQSTKKALEVWSAQVPMFLLKKSHLICLNVPSLKQTAKTSEFLDGWNTSYLFPFSWEGRLVSGAMFC